MKTVYWIVGIVVAAAIGAVVVYFVQRSLRRRFSTPLDTVREVTDVVDASPPAVRRAGNVVRVDFRPGEATLDFTGEKDGGFSI